MNKISMSQLLKKLKLLLWRLCQTRADSGSSFSLECTGNYEAKSWSFTRHLLLIYCQPCKEKTRKFSETSLSKPGPIRIRSACAVNAISPIRIAWEWGSFFLYFPSLKIEFYKANNDFKCSSSYAIRRAVYKLPNKLFPWQIDVIICVSFNSIPLPRSSIF